MSNEYERWKIASTSVKEMIREVDTEEEED